MEIYFRRIPMLCLRQYEVEHVLGEIEQNLNSHPLAYMSEEDYAESITPHHLLYGCDIKRKILTIL